MSIQQRIQEQISSDRIVLYMKGNKTFPMCGFSAQVVNLFKQLDLDYKDYNILEDFELREGIKAFSDWPTIPQLYVAGEFIGGCDIIMDMHQSGELEDKLSSMS
ncbi:MAG: monothiol glutaredoxin, Grx4 family [Legionellales bacterium]|nr:monothiol glutaredoxin, Grx4 family [Legionellales bacterium]|tara:strand:- start:1041 stop:1352 length:312 start_codon:yes stop_codon:yes gene_type:complete